MSQPKVAIAITADDKTARGAKSAEKRLGAIPKHSSSVVRRGLGELSRQGRSTIRTIGAVEQAGARVFGNASITSGFASRLGGIRAAAAAAGTGLGEAAAGGSMLSTTLGVVGTAAGATIGILGAAAYAAFKMTSSWATGAASIGRTAATIGIGTDALQKFTAAAERAGVDKGTSIGALGGLSESLNGAAYGTNGEARAVLTKMGVKIERNKDGTANIEAMLPAIADAISRYNPYAQRVAAGALGIPDAALAAFRQGGKALSAEMKDAGDTAYVATPSDIKKAQRIDRKGTLVSQMKDKGLGLAGAGVADATEKGYDLALAGGRQLVSGATDFGGVVKNSFAPASAAVERGGRAIERAAYRMGGGGGLKNGVLKLSSQDVTDLKKVVATEWDKRSPSQLKGIIDTVLNRVASGKWGNTVAGVANARSQFSDINGPVAWRQGRHSIGQVPIGRVSARVGQLTERYLAMREGGVGSSVGDNLNYANPHYSDRKNLRWINKLRGPTLGSGVSIHRHGTTPDLERYRPGAFKVDSPVPVKVEVEFKNAPSGTRARVSAGNRSAPAISEAWAVHP